MSALTPEATFFAASEMALNVIFPTRFPTELLNTGWEIMASDGL